MHRLTLPREQKVLLLTTGLALGGAERQVMLLAKGLRERGWSTKVVSMLPPLALVGELEAADVQVISLAMRPGVPDPRAVLRLARILRRWRPQVLHSHMVHANLLARVTRLVAPVPVLISTAHSVFEGPRWREWAYRLTDPLCSLTTNVSQVAVDRYTQVGAVPESKILYVPNGIDTERISPRVGEAAGRFLWLAVGNLRPPKDYANLLTAWDRVHRHPCAPLLWIAGEGDCRATIERLAAHGGYGDSVRLLGARDDVPQLMRQAHSFVMSSSWEGLPMALLEASAAALPIVTTAVGGTADVVCDQESGFVVPPRDPDSLADAMLRMMELAPRTRMEMGRCGRERVCLRYGIERVLDTWENLYARLSTSNARGWVWRESLR
jgi:glycosyltransferase involved in cell wall biosynthesis